MSDYGKWQPIETAPKGVKVLTYGIVPGMMHPQTTVARYWPRHSFEVAEGYEEEDWVDKSEDGSAYMPEGWYEENHEEESAVNLKPTHWMPLPVPPVEE